jgi:hypothetical protein
MPETTLPVRHLFTFTASTAVAALIAGGPQGTRAIVEAAGTFEGERLRGTTKAPSGDWVTVRADGSMKVDVRVVMETDDGAAILMQYGGIARPGAEHIRVAPLFETGDERYAWLNMIQAVATGVSGGGKVTYEVYELL